MSDPKKLFTAREAAQAVLSKAKEILETSDLMKSEKLRKDGMASAPMPSAPPASPVDPGKFKSFQSGFNGALGKKEMKKYETENKKPAGNRYGSIEKDQKPVERDYNEYEVKSGNSKDSDGPRLARQVSPSKNPKEEAEGNNKSDGMEPRYEFKDKVKGELEKENAAAKGMPKDKNGNPGLGKSELSKGSKQIGWQHEKEHSKGVHVPTGKGTSWAGDKVRENLDRLPGTAAKEALKNKAKEIHSNKLAEMKEMPKPNLGKAENPDKAADAKLGEKVEKDVEKHFKENKEAEKKEGHKLMAKSSEHETEHASIPRLILSAKLSKFCEHMHSKRKHREAQGEQAVGHDGPAAPEAGSTQAGEGGHPGHPMEKKYEGFKAVEASAAKSGASNPAAVAAAAGREKYGKQAFQHAAAAGKKMGKK